MAEPEGAAGLCLSHRCYLSSVDRPPCSSCTPHQSPLAGQARAAGKNSKHSLDSRHAPWPSARVTKLHPNWHRFRRIRKPPSPTPPGLCKLPGVGVLRRYGQIWAGYFRLFGCVMLYTKLSIGSVKNPDNKTDVVSSSSSQTSGLLTKT